MPSEYAWSAALVLVVGALLGIAAVTGAVAPWDEPEPDAEPAELVEDASESVSNVPISGVRTERVERPGEIEEVTVAVDEEPPDQSRIQLVRSGGPGSNGESEAAADRTVANGTVIAIDEKVINGSTMWQYNEDEERVVRKETDGYWISDTQSFGSHIEEMLEIYEFEYVGTETVEGHETYVVEMTPPDDEAVELSIDVQVGDAERQIAFERFQNETWVLAKETWWIEIEMTYPVKQRLEWADADGNTVASTTRTYEELEIGVEHDEDVFEFEPSSDADVVEPDRPESERFDTHEEAESALPFELPRPDLGSEYELANVMVQERDNRTSAVMLYYDGSTSISIGVSDSDQIEPKQDVVETNVGEIDGTLVAADGRPFVSWECGDLAYRVHGPADADTLVGTAESIGCE